MTSVEAISLIIASASLGAALASLGVAVRAHRLSKKAIQIQLEGHQLNLSELNAKREPRFQILNETFLSTWQRHPNAPRIPAEELDLAYSSVLSNKGESVATLHFAAIELGIAEAPLDAPRPVFSVPIAGPMYLAAGESVALSALVTSDHLKFIRLFSDLPSGVVVCSLVIHFSGYSKELRRRRTEIYRINIEGAIISKAGYEAASTNPRSYLVTEDEAA